MAEQHSISKLKQHCQTIKEMEPDKDRYIRRTEWGEISFESIEEDLDVVFWIAGQLADQSLAIVPQNTVDLVNASLENIISIISRVDNFTLTSGDPLSTRNDLVRRFQKEVSSIMNSIGLWILFMAFRSGEVENWRSKMNEQSVEHHEALQEFRDHADQTIKEIDSIMQTAQATSSGTAAHEFTKEFAEEAKSAKVSARRWLMVCGTLAAAVLGFSIWLLVAGLPADTPIELAQQFGAKLIVISILFYAVAWSGRIVLANFHLASINKHRAVSLQTLQAFHQAADDASAKDAVVMEAARAVYENVPSGYLGRNEPRQANARVLDIVRSSKLPDNTD